MEEKDVVISWYASGEVAKDAFERPTAFIQMPPVQGQKYDQQLADLADAAGTYGRPLLAILKKFAPGIRPSRIALLGFSEGCQGVRAMLRSNDARRIDSAIAIDGIHGQFKPASKTDVEPAYLSAWAAFARMAAEGSRLFVDTTSSIRREYPFLSTTQTADWIWREATGRTDVYAQNMLPVGVLQTYDPPLDYPAGQTGALVWPEVHYPVAPFYQARNVGSLWILNYSNLDPTGHNDHIFQAHEVLPMVLRSFLAARWNQIAPDQGICVLAAGEDESPPQATGCFAPTRLSDLYLGGGGEAAPLDIDAFPNTSLPTISSPPPVGTVAPAAAPPRLLGDDTTGRVLKWGAGVLASAALLAGARWVGSYIAQHPLVAKLR